MRGLVDAHHGAPPWRRLAAFGASFTLGLLLVALGLAGWWTAPSMALGGAVMLGTLIAVAIDRRARAS